MSAEAYRPRSAVPFAEQLRTDPSAMLDVWAGRDPVSGAWPEQLVPAADGALVVELVPASELVPA